MMLSNTHLFDHRNVISTVGYLFDVYHFEDLIYLWILDDNGKAIALTDQFFPEIYIAGDKETMHKLVRRLLELHVLASKPTPKQKKHFYENRWIHVLALQFQKASFLRTIYSKIYHFIDKLDIYHSDIDIPSHYMLHKGIFPLAKIRADWLKLDSRLSLATPQNNRLMQIKVIEDPKLQEYSLPPLRTLSMQLTKSHRLGLSPDNPLRVQTPDKKEYVLTFSAPDAFIRKLNQLLTDHDPDVILSSFGDQILFPAFFSMAQKSRLPLKLDRDPGRTVRKIITRGSSYNSYGNMIYRAPSYPLFGRWHIDSANSFVYKESELYGILELARMSRLPVQKMARASTGNALTYMEIKVALEQDYLVPWQKSSVEEAKTAYELLQIDKGGLVFEPDIRNGFVFEGVYQLDFAQMYPSIMVMHNISPETVLCRCCANEQDAPRVPEAGYHICIKRKGVVSQALTDILQRRRWLKQRSKDISISQQEREIADARQRSIKWLLVTSFGYLGYRNAKFGRLESHESVTAFGREKLLQAKELAEKRGFFLINAITDSIFIQKKKKIRQEDIDKEIKLLCTEIRQVTGIEMGIDGFFTWLVFSPSKMDKKDPVSNRYFGRLFSGEIKVRGIMVRRKDIPLFIRKAQWEMLSLMQQKTGIAELRELHPQIELIYRKYDALLRARQVPWQELLLRKTVGKELESYTVENATALSLQQLQNFSIEVQPGEKLRYLILAKRHKNPSQRYQAEEVVYLKNPETVKYDYEAYLDMLWEALREVWEGFAPDGFFERGKEGQGMLFTGIDSADSSELGIYR